MKRRPPTRIDVLCTGRVSRSSGIWLWVRYFVWVQDSWFGTLCSSVIQLVY